MRSQGARPAAAAAAAVVGTLAVFAGPAAAHDQWLEADPPRGAAGQPIAFTLWVGEHFTEAERKLIPQRSRYARAELVGPGTRRDVRSEIHEQQAPFATLTPPAPGTWVLALDATPIEVELPADKFNHYLDEEGLTAVKQLRAARGQSNAPGRERYTRSLKTLVEVGERVNPKTDDAPTRPIGQELEIVPDANPTALRPGARLGFHVLLRNQPLVRADILVATRAGKGVTTRKLQTDQAGHATVRLDRAGSWMIRLVHVERSTQPDADWRSFWSSLTFTVEGKGQRGKK